VNDLDDLVVNTDILPEPLLSRIHSRRVRITELNGHITLIPIAEKTFGRSRLFGMFEGSGLSTDEYFKQKQIEKRM
jgi:hypothetical protein